jgi:hypothetical protein
VQSQKKISDKLLICQLSTDMVNTYVTEWLKFVKVANCFFKWYCSLWF